MRLLAVSAVLIASVLLSAFDSADYPTQWKGSYFCAQGVTDVTLTLRGDPGGPAQAIFEFYANPTNPGVAPGSFTMRGTIADDADATSGPTVTLFGDRWISQPHAGWMMLNLSGRFHSNGEAFVGDVIPEDGAPNVCSAIALVRTAVGSEVR